MKQKCKVLVEEQVDKLIKKKITSKVKESQKMLQWIKMDSNKLKWARQATIINELVRGSEKIVKEHVEPIDPSFIILDNKLEPLDFLSTSLSLTPH